MGRGRSGEQKNPSPAQMFPKVPKQEQKSGTYLPYRVSIQLEAVFLTGSGGLSSPLSVLSSKKAADHRCAAPLHGRHLHMV